MGGAGTCAQGGRALFDQQGHIGHDAHQMRSLGQLGFQLCRGKAGGNAHEQGAARTGKRCDAGKHGRHDLRLNRQKE